MKAKYVGLCLWIQGGVGKFTTLVLVLLLVFIPLLSLTLISLISPPRAFAVTPPDRGLGVADSYAVFGAAGVTNTGAPTHIWGDVGANSSVTGLDDATQVDGSINTAALVAGVATDASSTYDSLMSVSQGTPATPTFDLAGTNTIGPGVYNVGASTLNGVLTLDGAGVYIFRSTSSETTAVGGTMNLINGACAGNVFWAISTSMTIGTSAHIEGTIIASTGNITLGTNATLVGRAISLTKNVTLLSNQITQPVCAAPTPTSTPTPTPTSTPTPTPTSTPTPTPSSSSSSGGSASAPAAKVCPNLNCVTPLVIESRRADADSIYISWGPYAGISTFIVQYGLENGKWLYNTKVTGFSTTINALPSNQSIWVLIEPTDDCSVGLCGVAKLVGGPSLPVTGFAPHKNNIPWYIPAGIFILSFFLLKLLRVLT